MTIRLNDITLTQAEAQAFVAWLRELVALQDERAASAAREQGAQALMQRRAEQITDIARQYAEEHGPLEWMVDAHQATAACASWHESAGYMDLAGGSSLDYDEEELWQQAYVTRLEELRAAKRQG